MKLKMISVMTLAILFGVVYAAFGCVGARPLAMGGAFVGLADDVNATYWNPAGLSQISENTGQATWMHTSNNRDEINYQEYGAIAIHLLGPGAISKLSIGASYIRDRVGKSIEGTIHNDNQDWYWVSLAYDTGKYGSIGVNYRKIDDNLSGYSVDTDDSFDIGYLYRPIKQLSLGLLVQNVNEPETTTTGVDTIKYARNYRAGFAYRPFSDTVVSVEGYDLNDDANMRSMRAGIEKIFPSFTLRAGYIGLGADDDKGFTCGIGVNKSNVSLDAAYLMGDFDNTIMVSGTINFL